MVKVSVSFSDYVFEKYLLDFRGNRSKFIEAMFVKGIEELHGWKVKR